jgi:2-(1,2-epoxy-1,2-dihydrophenyl)acetyl-CoA isomerase
MISDAAVLLSVDAGVARLVLNRAATGNAMDPALVAGLRERTQEIEQRDDIRAVVLAATGKTFCVGGDLRYFETQGDDVQAAVHALASDLHAVIASLVRLEAPVIAAVNGVVAGGGLSLVCAADIAIAAASATFTSAYTAVGLSPDGGSTWFLPRLVGTRRAAELMLTNPRLDAQSAADAGILTRVVADEELESEVERVASLLAAGPTRAHAAVKRLLRGSDTGTLEVQLADEAATIAELAAGHDGREGVAAFLAKRPPVFEGR